MIKLNLYWWELLIPAQSRKLMSLIDGCWYSELILDEHPQIKALIISYLDFELGADVLTLLPDDIQADIVRGGATLETVEPGAIKGSREDEG